MNRLQNKLTLIKKVHVFFSASLSLFGNGLFVGWSSIVMDTDLYNMVSLTILI